MFKRIVIIAATAAAAAGLAACSNDADVASRNLSQAADNFKIARCIVFYNGITNQYILVIRGYCSLGHGNETKSVTVTCKTGLGQYKKHFLGLSDNVTYFAEQIDAAKVSAQFYKVIFKPTTVIPDVELR